MTALSPGQLADFELKREITACREALDGTRADRADIAVRLAVCEAELADRRQSRRGLLPGPVSERFPEDAG